MPNLAVYDMSIGSSFGAFNVRELLASNLSVCGREAELDRPNANDGEHEVLWAGNWSARSLALLIFFCYPQRIRWGHQSAERELAMYVIEGPDTWCTRIGT